MSYEQRRRGEKLIERRMKWATFPVYKTLNEFSLNEQPSLTKKQFNQLADLSWLDQVYNSFGTNWCRKNPFINRLRNQGNTRRIQSDIYINGRTYSCIKNG